MVYLQLFIISKSGGLIYNQDLSEAAPQLNANDWLRLGGNFYGMHAIAAQIAPVVSGGIEKLETGSFKLQCFQVCHTTTTQKPTSYRSVGVASFANPR
jgi:hypothetical protein